MPCCEGSRHSREFSRLFVINKYSKEPNSRKASDIPLGTARLPIPKCIRNERLLRSKCILDQNITRQREPGL